jgi:hypothetical protein
MKHAQLVARLLRKSDREQAVQSKRVRCLLANMNARAQDSALDNWVARYCKQTPTGPAESQVLEPQEAPDSVPSGNERTIDQEDRVNGTLAMAGAPALVETPAGPAVRPSIDSPVDPALGPAEDFVKAMNGLPR